MKKNVLTIIIASVLIFLGWSVSATTITFSSANISVVEGDVFDLDIGLNPQGSTSYTAKAEVRYPADLLEVKSFSLATGWMVVSQRGYDQIDNSNGLLVKTGGYPGGITNFTKFGTIRFLAKKTGSGIVKVTTNSLVLNAANQNVLVEPLVEASINISASATPTEGLLAPPPAGGIQTEEGTVVPEEGIPLFDVSIMPPPGGRRGLIPVFPILAGLIVVGLVATAVVLFTRRSRVA